MEPENPTDTQKSLPPPPPLPPRLLALPPIVLAGTATWFVLSCLLVVLRYAYDLFPPIWLWTALAGTTLGLIGLPIMWWQRTASRRGTRGAQRDL
jgi:Protein of unknown function (DUF2530)